MNEKYNNCACGCVEPKDTTNMSKIIGDALGHLEKLNGQLSSICETMYGVEYGTPQKFEVQCMSEALVLLLDKAQVANEQAQRIRDGL